MKILYCEGCENHFDSEQLKKINGEFRCPISFCGGSVLILKHLCENCGNILDDKEFLLCENCDLEEK